MSIWNTLCAELGSATGEGPAKAAEMIAAYYDIKLRHMKQDPVAVAEFDAEALGRAEERAEDMGS